jgi:hypothetical protein
MTTRVRSWPVASFLAAGLIAVAVGPAPAAQPGIAEITATRRGAALIEAARARHRTFGVRLTSLRAWRLPAGDYLVGPYLPKRLSTSTSVDHDGRVRVQMTFDVRPGGIPPSRPLAAVTAASWAWREQACFTRVGNPEIGYLDSCYAIHRLVNESSPRDYYKLEQYGTVGAGMFRKIYDGWLSAVRASGSAAMSWVDWSPRGDLSGSCQGIPLSISALGVGFSASGLMCEQWNMTKGSAAGTFKQQWSCGCVWPFGQPWPNDREIRYLQAVSVANGKRAVWTLSAGYTAV